MPHVLSAFAVSRYPEETLSDSLPGCDPRDWMQGMVGSLREALPAEALSSSSADVSPEGRLVCAIAQTEVSSDEDAVATLRVWTQALIQKTVRLPVTFYLTLGRTPQMLDLSYIDEGLYRVGGPLILIESNYWDGSEALQREFVSSGVAPFFTDGLGVVVREPETEWIERFEHNLDRIRNIPGRYFLDYNPSADSRLDPALQEERKQLDNLINSPEPGQRQSLKPKKVTIRVLRCENAQDVSKRAYQDIPVGRKEKGRKTSGGRSLIIACNTDVNLISGWRSGDPVFEVHNSVSLHFTPSIRPGSLPEAMASECVVLKKAWIRGNYQAPELPDLSQQPNRMVWPQYNLPDSEESK